MSKYDGIFLVTMAWIVLLSTSCSHDSNIHISQIKLKPTHTEASNIGTLQYSNQIESNFEILYWGPKRPLITIDNYKPLNQRDIIDYINESQNLSHPEILNQLSKRLPEAGRNDLNIYVDSNQIYPISCQPSLLNSHRGRYQDTVLAYPVIIENVSSFFFEMAFDNRVALVLQAKNDKDKWQQISHFYLEYCGTGLHSHPLFPEEIVITSVPLLQGSQKTKARLALQGNYSNSFTISINDEIFINPFIELEQRNRSVLKSQ